MLNACLPKSPIKSGTVALLMHTRGLHIFIKQMAKCSKFSSWGSELYTRQQDINHCTHPKAHKHISPADSTFDCRMPQVPQQKGRKEVKTENIPPTQDARSPSIPRQWPHQNQKALLEKKSGNTRWELPGKAGLPYKNRISSRPKRRLNSLFCI